MPITDSLETGLLHQKFLLPTVYVKNYLHFPGLRGMTFYAGLSTFLICVIFGVPLNLTDETCPLNPLHTKHDDKMTNIFFSKKMYSGGDVHKVRRICNFFGHVWGSQTTSPHPFTGETRLYT